MKFESIHDFEVGQVFGTKKGSKMEVTAVHKDFSNGLTEQEVYDCQDEEGKEKFKWGMGSVELKTFVHRDSKNCKPYGWAHNAKWFKGCMRLDGRDGMLRTLETGGWKLKS